MRERHSAVLLDHLVHQPRQFGHTRITCRDRSAAKRGPTIRSYKTIRSYNQFPRRRIRTAQSDLSHQQVWSHLCLVSPELYSWPRASGTTKRSRDALRRSKVRQECFAMSATGRLSFDYWSMTRTYRRDFRALPFCDPRSSGRPLSTLPLSGVAAEPPSRNPP